MDPASPLSLVAPPAPVPADDNANRHRLATTILTLALVLLGLFTLWNFLGALAWAGVFAIALWPLYRRAVARFGTGRHNLLLPLVFTAGVALLFVVPLSLAGLKIADEAHAATEFLRNAQRNGIAEPDFLHHMPFLQTQIDGWWQENLADPGSANELVQRVSRGHVGDISRLVVAQVARRLTLFVFTLVTLFFLFKEGDAVTGQMRRAANRAFGPGGERFGRQIIASVHGTVDGLILVGLGEGVVLGCAYAVAGVPHPTVFGAITAVAAMLPMAAPVVFGIASLILLASGSTAWAIALFCTGMAVTFIADHFIRPVLIGGATKLPFLWVLLGILGGVEAWGLLGLFLGPAIMAALILLWREWSDEAAG